MNKIYVHATLKLKIGGYGEFCRSMAKQVPVLEGYGWMLLGAWNTVVGPICTVVDLWELPDANCFFEAKSKWLETPEYKDFHSVTSQYLIEEMVSMTTKTPYSP